MQRTLSKLLTLWIFSCLFATGCFGASETPDEIEAALSLENGGYLETDEPPAFGHDTSLDSSLAADIEVDDATAHTAAVTELLSRPGAAIYHVQIQWGQFDADADEEAYDWSGHLSVNRGAITLARTTNLELYDNVAREDPTSLSLNSVTGPADGLIVRIIDSDPAAPEPLTLAYSRSFSVSGAPSLMEVSELTGRPAVAHADGEGNRMVVAAIHSGVCPRGFLSGRWGLVSGASGGDPASGASPASGIMRGRVTDATGAILGHVEGIWGTQPGPLGAQVFFAKYINDMGNFVGILRGTAANGVFEGDWMSMGTAIGTVRGQYRAANPPSGSPSASGSPSVGGHFLGLVLETGC